MPPPWISNIGSQPPRQPQQAKGQESPADTLARSKALADTARNFNDSPVGRILGSSSGSPVTSAPTAAAAPGEAAGAAAGAGEAAGAGAAAAGEAGGASALAELAPLAALA